VAAAAEAADGGRPRGRFKGISAFLYFIEVKIAGDKYESLNNFNTSLALNYIINLINLHKLRSLKVMAMNVCTIIFVNCIY
jgi:hypothetical protein